MTKTKDDDQVLEREAIERIAPSKLKWLLSLKPGDTVAFRWRGYRAKPLSIFLHKYPLKKIKEIVIYDPYVVSRISVQLEENEGKLDSSWIEHIDDLHQRQQCSLAIILLQQQREARSL